MPSELFPGATHLLLCGILRILISAVRWIRCLKLDGIARSSTEKNTHLTPHQGSTAFVKASQTAKIWCLYAHEPITVLSIITLHKTNKSGLNAAVFVKEGHKQLESLPTAAVPYLECLPPTCSSVIQHCKNRHQYFDYLLLSTKLRISEHDCRDTNKVQLIYLMKATLAVKTWQDRSLNWTLRTWFDAQPQLSSAVEMPSVSCILTPPCQRVWGLFLSFLCHPLQHYLGVLCAPGPLKEHYVLL